MGEPRPTREKTLGASRQEDGEYSRSGPGPAHLSLPRKLLLACCSLRAAPPHKQVSLRPSLRTLQTPHPTQHSLLLGSQGKGILLLPRNAEPLGYVLRGYPRDGRQTVWGRTAARAPACLCTLLRSGPRATGRGGQEG